jgi:transposase
MRKSFNGLSGCVEQHFKADPLNGHLYVFFNRRAKMVKILVWDRTGFCIWAKRLEQGRFAYNADDGFPEHTDVARLLLVLEGIDLSGSRQRKRFHIEKH